MELGVLMTTTKADYWIWNNKKKRLGKSNLFFLSDLIIDKVSIIHL